MTKRSDVDDLLANYLSDEEDPYLGDEEAASALSESDELTITSFADVLESRTPRTTAEIEALLGEYLAESEAEAARTKRQPKPNDVRRRTDPQIEGLLDAYRRGDDTMVRKIAEHMSTAQRRQNDAAGEFEDEWAAKTRPDNAPIDPKTRNTGDALPEIRRRVAEGTRTRTPAAKNGAPEAFEEPETKQSTQPGPLPLAMPRGPKKDISAEELPMLEEGQHALPYLEQRGTMPGLGSLGPDEAPPGEDPEDDWRRRR